MTEEMDFKRIEDSEGRVLVSVYGTLKQGWGNHSLLNKAPVHVGSTTVDRLDGVGFPIVKLGGKYKLKVEVYSVDEDELRSLDGLEGFSPKYPPSFYNRVTTDVTLEDGSTILTYIYEYVSEVDDNIVAECTYNDSTDVYNWVGTSRHW